jgi:hypothetical protein
MAFVGRVAVSEERFVPTETVLPVLREARSAIAGIQSEGTALYVRNEILGELERTISFLTTSRLPLGTL